MKKTKMKIVLGILLILMLGNFVVSYAIEKPNIEIEEIIVNDFASLSSKVVGYKEEFYIQLDLSKIEYTKFKVDITNTLKLNVTDMPTGIKDVSSTSNVTSFTVDKNEITLDKLGVFYTSPNQNTVIKFEIKITSLDLSKDTLVANLENIKSELTGYEEELKKQKESLEKITDKESEEYKQIEEEIKLINEKIDSKSKEIEEIQSKVDNFTYESIDQNLTLTVNPEEVESNIESKPSLDKDFDKDKLMTDKLKDKDMEIEEMLSAIDKLEGNLKTANNKINSLTQGETYQGSQNNYLESLSIEEGTFKNEFNKTMTSYFVRVDDNVDEVTVKATADDSNATVTIYGNKELEEGKNKILITVTAENGNTRYYKIYVIK